MAGHDDEKRRCEQDSASVSHVSLPWNRQLASDAKFTELLRFDGSLSLHAIEPPALLSVMAALGRQRAS
jgi:hypothetical protein